MVWRPTHRRLHPKRNHREMGRTIARRLIRTLHLAEKSIPRFRIGHLSLATDGNVALVSAPDAALAQRWGRRAEPSPSLASVGAKSLLPTDEGSPLPRVRRGFTSDWQCGSPTGT